jgi:hypothetical protein
MPILAGMATVPRVSGAGLMTTAAGMLHIPAETLRKWCRSNKISYVRLSKVDIRFREEDLEEFIDSRLHKRKSHSGELGDCSVRSCSQQPGIYASTSAAVLPVTCPMRSTYSPLWEHARIKERPDSCVTF